MPFKFIKNSKRAQANEPSLKPTPLALISNFQSEAVKETLAYGVCEPERATNHSTVAGGVAEFAVEGAGVMLTRNVGSSATEAAVGAATEAVCTMATEAVCGAVAEGTASIIGEGVGEVIGAIIGGIFDGL